MTIEGFIKVGDLVPGIVERVEKARAEMTGQRASPETALETAAAPSPEPSAPTLGGARDRKAA